jgi:hypothetical protein
MAAQEQQVQFQAQALHMLVVVVVAVMEPLVLVVQVAVVQVVQEILELQELQEHLILVAEAVVQAVMKPATHQVQAAQVS